MTRNQKVLANIHRYDKRSTRASAKPATKCSCGAKATNWKLTATGTLNAFCPAHWARRAA